MCTVTFVPSGDKVFITSNRDEKNARKQALPPAVYNQLVFPKDAEAGGTWIAMNRNGNAVVLLNGAFKKFVHQPFHIKSRGLILLEVIGELQPTDRFKNMDLHLSAPFTLIIWQDQALFECRWDGVKKYIRNLDGSAAHIWSSATLYNHESKKKRERWLGAFLREIPEPEMTNIMNFHLLAGNGDANDNLTMSRDGIYSTVSITSIECSATEARMLYYDCKDNSCHQHIAKPCNLLKGKFISYENN